VGTEPLRGPKENLPTNEILFENYIKVEVTGLNMLNVPCVPYIPYVPYLPCVCCVLYNISYCGRKVRVEDNKYSKELLGI